MRLAEMEARQEIIRAEFWRLGDDPEDDAVRVALAEEYWALETRAAPIIARLRLQPREFRA